MDFHLRIVTPDGKAVELHGPANIVDETSDAIVNAANSSLLGGGGVDGAIHDAGGPAIVEECKQHVARHGRLPAGQAMLTSGGNLKAKYIIHTVGPIYRDGMHGEADLLASCYRSCLALAHNHAIKSISFPAISTGAYGYPLGEAAELAISTVFEALLTVNVDRVRFILFDHASVKTYKRATHEVIRSKRADYRVEKIVSPARKLLNLET